MDKKVAEAVRKTYRVPCVARRCLNCEYCRRWEFVNGSGYRCWLAADERELDGMIIAVDASGMCDYYRAVNVQAGD